MARLNTALAAQGAEFLVLGRLLIEGIEAYKAYVNHPGYDLVAVHPDTHRSARLSVKSRYASDFDGGFPLKNTDCDFVIFVALNRGFHYHRKSLNQEEGIKVPDIYVFPMASLRDARRQDGWNKVFLRDIPQAQNYYESWSLISEFLAH